jgi:hypothetical protein
MPLWYILCQFGRFYANLVYFPPLWHIIPRKSGNSGGEALFLSFRVAANNLSESTSQVHRMKITTYKNVKNGF